jgi:hypothetical protein
MRPERSLVRRSKVACSGSEGGVAKEQQTRSRFPARRKTEGNPGILELVLFTGGRYTGQDAWNPDALTRTQ